MTKQAEQVAGRCFLVTGYRQHVVDVGVYDAASDYDDMTDSQAALIHLCVRDSEMAALCNRVLERAGEIEDEHKLEKARPWFDVAEYLAAVA